MWERKGKIKRENERKNIERKGRNRKRNETERQDKEK